MTVIESRGSTSLVQVGSNYFFYPVGGSSGPELMLNGAPVTVGEFGGWTPIGAEKTTSGYGVGFGAELRFNNAPVVVGDFGAWAPIAVAATTSGYDVAWKFGNTDQYTVWSIDAYGNYLANITGGGGVRNKHHAGTAGAHLQH